MSRKERDARCQESPCDVHGGFERKKRATDQNDAPLETKEALLKRIDAMSEKSPTDPAMLCAVKSEGGGVANLVEGSAFRWLERIRTPGSSVHSVDIWGHRSLTARTVIRDSQISHSSIGESKSR